MKETFIIDRLLSQIASAGRSMHTPEKDLLQRKIVPAALVAVGTEAVPHSSAVLHSSVVLHTEREGHHTAKAALHSEVPHAGLEVAPELRTAEEVHRTEIAGAADHTLAVQTNPAVDCS